MDLKAYIPLVDFIAGIVGPFCEVVLHDVTNVNESIIAIKNGHISGRKAGGPLTDLGLKLLKEASYEKQDFLLNYPSKTMDGKPLRSSTFFIKDNEGKLIGMLCINIDISAPLLAKKFVDDFLMGCGSKLSVNENFEKAIDVKECQQPFAQETLPGSIDELIYTIISKTINDLNIPPERLSLKEKVDVVRELNEKGVFLLKGSVSKVAKMLKVSENSIYRYLNKK